MSQPIFQATAAAKIILFGEHAVVYGCPAIAVPISTLRATASVLAGDHSGLHIAAEDLSQVMPVNVETDQVDNALALTARLVLRKFHLPPPDVTIAIQSQIPMASGLGSGAAVSTALARALCGALHVSLDAATLNGIIYEVEKVHHGTPSGIDNTVIVYEQPVYYVREQPIETFSIGRPLHMLVGDTGKGALTKIAVGAVRDLYEESPERVLPILEEIRQLVVSARKAIEQGNETLIGELMNRNHAYLRELTVSSPELDQLVDAARSAGALGAKLSGGGRGGNMIALVKEENRHTVEAALREAGAVRVLGTTLS
ncbi:MAG: mevalonate kinase [Anaerolineae bacterium]